MINLLLNKRSFICFVISLLLFLCSILIFTNTSYAMTPVCYDYKTVLDKLPKNYQKDDYIINSGGTALLVFAKYKNSDDNYRTTVKHSSDALYYCVDYSAHFTDSKDFIVNDSVFSNELRARIAYAIHLGATKWNSKASSDYTTGNFVEDYYMTQLVIHGLIHKYGGTHKDHGVDLNNIVFKKGTDKLEKCTKAFYKACCDSIYSDKTGSYQSAEFSFNKAEIDYLYLSNDEKSVVSDFITCKTNVNNASVSEFTRSANLYNSNNAVVASNINNQAENKYNSLCIFNIPITTLDTLDPGVYTATIVQGNVFHRAIAKEWKCQDKDFKDNQEVAGLSYIDTKASSNYSLPLMIGRVELEKTDSLTGEEISDAQFQLLQYDVNVGDYISYKNLTYDSNTKKYYSGNIYLYKNNPDKKFKVIEIDPGTSHINDWAGHEFILSPDNTYISIHAENAPILGSLKVTKSGESFKFDKDKQMIQISDKDIPLPKVKFDLYAKEDISYKNVLIYQKDQKILDFETSDNGEYTINDIIPGKYYLKESATDPLYVLDKKAADIEIKKENGLYSEVTYTCKNYLKQCSISLFKYTTAISDKDKKEKVPIEGCRFGLYTSSDIKDVKGNLLISKDTLIKEGITNSKGELSFNDLIYTDYYLKELEVPKGVILCKDNIPVKKDQFELKADTTKEFLAKIEVYNEKQPYKIKLSKMGEQFIGALQKESDNGAYYLYQYELAPLKDVTYALYNDKDVLITSKTTDNDGVIVFDKLEYGNYYCIEQSAPFTHTIDTNPINIQCTSLEPKDASTGEITVEQTANDNMCDCSIEILKTGEKAFVNNKALDYTFIPLEGIVYGVYQDFDYIFPSGITMPKDTCVGYITTDDKGLGSLNGKLPEGKYYLKELKAKNGYILDENIHSFEIKAADNKHIHIDLTANPLRNYLSKSGVKIIKCDANTGKALKGVEFTLYDQNNNSIGVYKTNKKGEITVEDLPYGNYYFIETKCLKGYYSSNNHYNFTLNSTEFKTLEITNTPILKLGFTEHYKALFVIISLLLIFGIAFLYYNDFIKTKKQ